MTTKLNKVTYDRMMIQAEEARDLGLTKLASNVFGAIGSMPREERLAYNENDLRGDIDAALWKIATDIVAYHDLKSADIQTIEEAIEGLNEVVVAEIEKSLGVYGEVGKLEEKLIGEK